jgi:hypothetical protein
MPPAPPSLTGFLIFSAVLMLLVLAGSVMALRRNRERLKDIRARRAAIFQGEEEAVKPRKPSDIFHDMVWLPLCERVEGAAKRNGYYLVKWERQRVWRSKSTLVLETLIKELEATVSEEETARAIGELPPGMDRPDPTGWCERVESAVAE